LYGRIWPFRWVLMEQCALTERNLPPAPWKNNTMFFQSLHQPTKRTTRMFRNLVSNNLRDDNYLLICCLLRRRKVIRRLALDCYVENLSLFCCCCKSKCLVRRRCEKVLAASRIVLPVFKLLFPKKETVRQIRWRRRLWVAVSSWDCYYSHVSIDIVTEVMLVYVSVSLDGASQWELKPGRAMA